MNCNPIPKMLCVYVRVRLQGATTFNRVTKHGFPMRMCACMSVLNKAALLHNHISKGYVCECLCVRVEPQGGLMQAEDPVKCFIFRCVNLLYFLLSLSQLGLPQFIPFELQIRQRLQYHMDEGNTAWSDETDLQMGHNECR